jgi:hypothetical protein
MATLLAHGKYSIRTCGRVVRVDAWGPWNVEQTLDYVQHLKTCMETMRRPFAMLSVSHVHPLLGSDSEDVLKESVRQRALLDCAAQATVLLDFSTAVVAEAQYRRIYIHEGLRCGIFRQIAPAVSWLISRGFTDVKGLRFGDSPTLQSRFHNVG